MPTRIVSLFAVFALVAPAIFAQTDPALVGTCEPAQAEAILETGNVRAKIYNDGGLFWKGGDNVYNVPKSGPVTAVFTANLLISGFIDDELRVAGSTYGPWEFWPGPLPDGGSPPVDCAPYDLIWSLSHGSDLDFSAANTTLTQQVLNWPVHLGAPFVDVDDVEGYQPERGDYPAMSGDSQLWWVMNDRGGTHERFKTHPLGIEVQASAFGFDAENELGNVTFYRYHITNRGTSIIRDVHVGMHQDIDLGFSKDDSAGSDSTLALLYVYQLNNEDGRFEPSYGVNPPAVGYTILEARHSAGGLPTDLDLPPSNHATSAHNAFNGGGVGGDPNTAQDAYYYMSGRWKNGEPVREGESGFGSTGPPAPFWMPGDPVQGTFWSERNTDGLGAMMPPSDRKLTLAYGAFDLAPGEWAQFTFAIVWAQGADHLDSITQLKHLTRDLHESKGSILAPRSPKPPRFEDANPPVEPSYPFWVDKPFPNPISSGDELSLRLSARWDTPITITVTNVLGQRLIVTSRSAKPGTQSYLLKTTGLVPGIYLVKVQQRHESVVQRVIVQ